MGYYGHQPAAGENNSFKILDDISSHALTFDGTSTQIISAADDTLTFNNHRFIQGQRVTYNNGGGSNIGGLTSGTVYYIIKHDTNIIKLATSASNAANGTAVNITSVAGSGTSQTLTIAFDGTNTKFKATYNNGVKTNLTRAAQLMISINGVIQQGQTSKSPTVGYAVDSDSTIIFSVAPVATDIFWGNLVASNFASFEVSDNDVDSFAGDGSKVDFSLSKQSVNNQNLLVTIDGVVQYPSDGTTARAYSASGNTITFTAAPANKTTIQVRHIGFAGGSGSGSGGVTGFYGRTGNVSLINTDDITVRDITCRHINSSGVITATKFVGPMNGSGGVFSGIVTITDTTDSTSTTTGALQVRGGVGIAKSVFIGGSLSIGGTITYEDVRNVDSIGIITARKGVHIGSAGSIFSPASNTLALGTNSAERLRIQSNGKVLINTTTVGATGANDLTLATTGSTGLTIRSGTSNDGNIFFSDATSGSAEYAGYIQYEHSNNALRFGTAEIERLRINSSGKVLIGDGSTYSPSGLLHIVGDDNSNGPELYLQVNNNNTTDNIGALWFGNNVDKSLVKLAGHTHSANNTADFTVSTSSGGTLGEKIRIDSSGRLLVGRTAQYASSAEKLSVNGMLSVQKASTSVAGLYVFNTDTTGSGTVQPYIFLHDGGGIRGALGLQYSTSNFIINGQTDIQFRTGSSGLSGTERLRINSSGHVGVNTDFTGSQTWRNGQRLEIFGGGGNVTGELHLGANRGDSNQSVGSINFFDNSQDSTHRHIALIEADKTGSTSNKRGGDLIFFTKNDNVAAPTEKIRITSAGQILIGETATSGMSNNDLGMKNNAAIRFRNAAGNAWINTVGLDNSNNLKLGWGGSVDEIHFGISGIGEQARFDSGGRLLVGTTASRAVNSAQGSLQIEGTGAEDSDMSIVRNQNNSGGPAICFGKSRSGSLAGNTVVQSGDQFGSLIFMGNDGTDLASQGARIDALCDGTPGGNDMPGRLTFSTTEDTADTATERLRITSGGKFGFNYAGTPPSETIHIQEPSGASVAGVTISHLSGGNRYGGRIQSISGTNAGLTLSNLFNSTYTDRVQIDGSGRVGINKFTHADSASALTIQNGASGSEHSILDIVCNDNETSRIYFSEDSNSAKGSIRYYYTSDANYMSFFTNGSANVNERIRIDSSGRTLLGPQVGNSSFNPQNTMDYCNAALLVTGGSIALGPKGNTTNTQQPGRVVYGWYMASYGNNGYLHIKTDLWAGGSPHGNNEYIMGGFRIHGYRYSSTGISEEIIYFHNWNGSYASLDIENWGSWNPGSTVYTSSDGYVVLRLDNSQYYGYDIDLVQHAWYTLREIKVLSATDSSSSSI